MQPLTQNSPHSGGNGHTVQNARDPAGPTKKLPREYPICPIILFDEVKFRSAPILLKGRRPQSTTSQ